LLWRLEAFWHGRLMDQSTGAQHGDHAEREVLLLIMVLAV
jgi:hypothetical protein